jgi:hypothetical protein
MSLTKTPLWVLDFEASGLSKSSYPIEVGVVGDNSRYSSLICREDPWTYWNKDAEAVHGIQIEELIKNGQSAIIVATELNRLLDGDKVYSDCKKWDQFWLDVLFDQCGLTPTFQLHHLPDELSDDQGEQFLTAYENIKNNGNYEEHRALDDALLIYEALVDIKLVDHL